MRPFTIVLKYRADGDVQDVEFKIDPGSKTTGIALVALFQRGRELVWGANLQHRGQAIRLSLESRRSLRRGRRGRKTRYRQARFLNRARREGWLPPSLESRVGNIRTWYDRLLKYSPIASAEVETVRFDMQVMRNPNIQGKEYQQGELSGYETREYLLEKWNRCCAYCGAKDVPLQVEHIKPRAIGGSNSVTNLTLACEPCNRKKGAKPVEDFLKGKPEVLNRVLAHAKAPLKDAAAVNATRYATGNAVKSVGLPTGFWSGGRTKKNRVSQGYEKDHFIDAACVGVTGESVFIPDGFSPLSIKAMGRGTRQVVRTDRYGFPRGAAGRVKRVQGFQTGDLVRLVQPAGKYAGEYVGRLASVRARGDFDIKTESAKVTSSYRNFQLIQRGDGYDYSN
jgi:5-methylcytosine-specific restriction endonuclease McrA